MIKKNGKKDEPPLTRPMFREEFGKEFRKEFRKEFPRAFAKAFAPAFAKAAVNLVTRDELRFEIRESEARIRADMMTKADKNEIMTILDNMNQRMINFQAEMAANVGAHERYDEKYNDHETRLRRLEYQASM